MDQNRSLPQGHQMGNDGQAARILLLTGSLEEIHRRTVITRMELFRENKTLVAESLGIRIKTLYNWLHQWGLMNSYRRQPGRPRNKRGL